MLARACFVVCACPSDCVTISCPRCYRVHPPSSVPLSAQVTPWRREHVAGTRYFLGLAVMQALWGPGCLFLGLAMVQRCGDLLGSQTRQLCGDECQTVTTAGVCIVFIICRSEVQIFAGTDGSGSQAVAEIGGDGARARLPNGSVSCGPHNGALQTTATAAHRLLPECCAWHPARKCE